MVRDASLRDAPHHEDRFVRPHPEEPPKAASRRVEVVHSGWSLMLAPMGLDPAIHQSCERTDGCAGQPSPLMAARPRMTTLRTDSQISTSLSGSSSGLTLPGASGKCRASTAP